MNQRASGVFGRDQKFATNNAANMRPEIVLLLAQAQVGFAVAQGVAPRKVNPIENIGLEFGSGSPLNLAKLAFFRAGNADLYISPVSAPANGKAATAKIDQSGTAATHSFSGLYTINGVAIPFTVLKGQTGFEALEAIQVEAEKSSEIPVSFLGGAAEPAHLLTANVGTLADFQAITDGKFQIGSTAVLGLDFSKITAKSEIAAVLNGNAGFSAKYSAEYTAGKVKIISKGPDPLTLLGPAAGGGTGIEGIKYFNGSTTPAAVIAAVGGSNMVLTAKWKGLSGNDLIHSLTDAAGKAITEDTHGISLTPKEFTEGAGIPDLQANLNAIPEALKITRIISQFSDDTNLDKVSSFCATREVERLSEMIRCYYCYWPGNTNNLSVAQKALTAKSAARIRDNYTSCQPLPTQELPVMAAAEIVSRVAENFGTEPGRPFRNVKLNAHPRFENYLAYDSRDALLKDGISNYELRNGSFFAMDLLSHYHPGGETIIDAEPPIKTFEEDHSALANMKFDLRFVFQESDTYKNAKFIAEGLVTMRQFIKTLADVRQTRNRRFDLWQNSGLIFSADWSKDNSGDPSFDAKNQARVLIPCRAKHAITGRIYDFTLSLTKSSV